MTESNVVNRWVRDAVEQAHIEQSRLLLIRLLEGRFPGQVMQDVIDTINTQPSQSMLEDWFDQANRAANLADFLRILRA